MPSNMAGFTLMESIFAMVIGGVMFALGAPSFSQTLENNRLASQTNELVGALRLARSEAVRRGVAVSVCRADSNGDACAAEPGSWENGWLVIAQDGSTLRQMPALKGRRSLTTSEGFNTAVAFSPLGEPSASGQFFLCERNDQGYAREIDLNGIGRISVIQHKASSETCDAS